MAHDVAGQDAAPVRYAVHSYMSVSLPFAHIDADMPGWITRPLMLKASGNRIFFKL
jgi:hypothetical protein